MNPNDGKKNMNKLQPYFDNKPMKFKKVSKLRRAKTLKEMIVIIKLANAIKESYETK